MSSLPFLKVLTLKVSFDSKVFSYSLGTDYLPFLLSSMLACRDYGFYALVCYNDNWDVFRSLFLLVSEL